MQPLILLTYPYSKISHDIIKISIHPIFLEEKTRRSYPRYSWLYFVFIKNLGQDTWAIRKCNLTLIDERGEKEDIEAEHFGGTQSILKAGDSFEYNTGATLSIPSAIVCGTYEMYNSDRDEILYAAIPPFSLDSPYVEHMHH